MRALVGVVLAALAGRAGAQGPAAPGSSSGRADYRIEASLDGELKRMEGTLELRWANRSGEAVRDLWFHLYLNAFSNNRSTHLIESDGKLRRTEMKDGWSWSRIKAVRVASAGAFQDVLPSLRYRRPDDDNAEDRTVFSIDLPQALGAGETVRVQIDWESQLPRVRRRAGWTGVVRVGGEGCPKLGV